MSFFNYNAKAVIRTGEYQLSQIDLEIIEVNSQEWVDKLNPPFDLCRYLMEMIDLRLSEALDESSRKKLAASVLNMSYFQFSDYLFKAKSETNKRIDLRKEKKTLNTILNSDREKHRQAQEKKLGKPISPKEHKINYQKNYGAIRLEKVIKSIDPERLKELRKIIQDYEELAVDCLSLVTVPIKDPLPIGCSKLGGHAHMLAEDKYPIDENGREMILLAQINVAEVDQLLPQRIPKKEGLLLFFASDEELGGQRNHGFSVRYYPDKSLLRPKTPLRSKSYHENPLQFVKSKSLPYTPWPLYEKFKKKMGSEAIHKEDLIQGEYPYNGSSFLGYGINIEMRPMIRAGKEISEDIGKYIPLLRLNSQYDEGVEKRMMFGDAGAIGFFIKPKDLENWNFKNVTFTTYN